MEDNIQDLVEFNNTCDEFIAGKYILVDIKISALLKTIASQEKIKNIIANCNEHFDFSYTYNQAVSEDETGNVLFNLPEDEKTMVAFIFSLLYKMNEKIIDPYSFVTKFYFEEGAEVGKEFINFANAIILPFKQAVNNLYTNRHIEVNSEDYQADYFDKLISTIQLIVNNIDTFRLKMNEKEEFTILLNALFLACENTNKKQVFANMIGLDYFTKINKRARNAYLSLEECFTS